MRADLIQSFDRTAVPREAALRWNSDPATLVHFADSQNFVYRFRHRGGQECFLRLTHEAHRTRELIVAETEFVAHLDRSGCAVAAPVPAADGRRVHTIATKAGAIHAAAFWAVYGQPVKWGNDAENRQILIERGELLARIHNAAQIFDPAGPRRFSFDQGELFTQPERVLDRQADPQVWDEYTRVREWLLALPRTERTFGLVHGDLLSSNCVRSGGKSIAFDFDDCCYQFFLFDLAVAISAGRDLPDKHRHTYLHCLLDGYGRYRAVPTNACEQIAWFARLSALYRYALHLGEFAEAPLAPTEQQERSRRRRAVLEQVSWC